MPVSFVTIGDSLPVYLIEKGTLDRADLTDHQKGWANANAFDGEAGKLLLIADGTGRVQSALFGMGAGGDFYSGLATGGLARLLPKGTWHFANMPIDPFQACLGLALGAYEFSLYKPSRQNTIQFLLPEGVDGEHLEAVVASVTLARDLINTPTNDMGPEELEKAFRDVASLFGADVSVTTGKELLDKNFPMIHAVGRAGAQEPRLLEMRWGDDEAPKLTLVGKGVCFDTGGLDIKPPSSMLLMKKDMGGAANILALARLIMAENLPVRLRVLIPAVENSISADAFRPGDVLKSRKGLSVEIGNTDAEGRLVLADALALADEEKPDLLIDMATLTGAARVALGPDLPPFFTDDEQLAASLEQAGRDLVDPLWRLPLWQPYADKLSSRIADMNNVTTDGFAGSITAALFLKRFVTDAKAWAHFDIFGWNPTAKPHAGIGGEAQAIRAIFAVLVKRYGE
ncbi:leucyl aminopeptidase family protein [Limoniibacter endophyticus]|uniref:Leucyl aminopeptidase n=1 Tax=Limoniibacter endophyticus TaxID=1565040 RepID=A0A8J3DHD9_9HYPH|nr:leucyl aminopeptidase family protein [Limoniibacter endophyticus]GHC67179.1 leucyl aminopeptidase [Limoniibacter endophyticus]